MANPLTEPQREEMPAELTEAHNVVSNLLSDLRSRDTAKSPAVKAAVKADRDLFQLGRYVEERIYDIVLPDAIRLVEFFRAQKYLLSLCSGIGTGSNTRRSILGPGNPLCRRRPLERSLRPT